MRNLFPHAPDLLLGYSPLDSDRKETIYRFNETPAVTQRPFSAYNGFLWMVWQSRLPDSNQNSSFLLNL